MVHALGRNLAGSAGFIKILASQRVNMKHVRSNEQKMKIMQYVMGYQLGGIFDVACERLLPFLSHDFIPDIGVGMNDPIVSG